MRRTASGRTSSLRTLRTTVISVKFFRENKRSMEKEGEWSCQECSAERVGLDNRWKQTKKQYPHCYGEDVEMIKNPSMSAENPVMMSNGTTASTSEQTEPSILDALAAGKMIETMKNPSLSVENPAMILNGNMASMPEQTEPSILGAPIAGKLSLPISLTPLNPKRQNKIPNTLVQIGKVTNLPPSLLIRQSEALVAVFPPTTGPPGSVFSPVVPSDMSFGMRSDFSSVVPTDLPSGMRSLVDSAPVVSSTSLPATFPPLHNTQTSLAISSFVGTTNTMPKDIYGLKGSFSAYSGSITEQPLDLPFFNHNPSSSDQIQPSDSQFHFKPSNPDILATNLKSNSGIPLTVPASSQKQGVGKCLEPSDLLQFKGQDSVFIDNQSQRDSNLSLLELEAVSGGCGSSLFAEGRTLFVATGKNTELSVDFLKDKIQPLDHSINLQLLDLAVHECGPTTVNGLSVMGL